MGIDVADQWVRVQAAKDEARREATRAAAREVLESYGAADLLAMLGLDAADEGATRLPLVRTQPRVTPRRVDLTATEREHGTPRGYRQHERFGEPQCRECQDTRNEYQRNRRASPQPRQQISPCGTANAYKRHRKHGETPCAACRRANTEYNRRQYQPRSSAA